jgi:epoxyqueuosine reductase
MIYIGYKDVKPKEKNMVHKEILSTLYEKLESHNCKGKVVSIKHIHELEGNIEKPHKNGLLDEEFYQRELRHFFEFDVSGNLPEAKSLIVVAVSQPHMNITFHPDGKAFPCLIPSNYSHKTDDLVQNIVESHLKSEGYYVEKAQLPLKSLAVHIGLAEYGRNNISYVKGMGSFIRLVAFVSDLPCPEDKWGELKIMKRCETCTICQKMCPTGAIPSNRILLQAERCLTFFSEWPAEFPDWLDPSWHHCLVGCLICQKTCPVNREFMENIEDGPTFSPVETDLILKDIPVRHLPKKTKEKLNELGILEYVGLLGRNFQVLMDNSKVSDSFKINTSTRKKANKYLR